MNATQIARRFVETFPDTTASAVQHGNTWYIVTDETGDGCFAYEVEVCADALVSVGSKLAAEREAQRAADAADIERHSDFAPYQVFCDEASPEENASLALAVHRAIGKRICHAASCDRVDLVYTYSIFDSDPAGGIAAWPQEDGQEFDADGDDEALDLVEEKLEMAALECNGADGYEAGDRIHAIVWDANGQIIGQTSVGIEEAE